MEKRRSTLAGRAWRLLRLALLWARKGGAFKRKHMTDHRSTSDCFKCLRAWGGRRSDRLRYGEREFSLDETPAFRHFKLHRSSSMRRLPCMEPPPVDFDDDNDDDGLIYTDDSVDGDRLNCEGSDEVEEEKSIDLKAEEFIANFYEEMKLQRQVSLIQYNEMLYRGTS